MHKIGLERVEEAVREVATLFVALAPLDVVLGAEQPRAFGYGLIFMGIGVTLFLLALYSEGIRLNA